MQYDLAYKSLGSTAAQAMKRYVDRHGYYLTVSELNQVDPSASWAKLPLLTSVAKRSTADWIIWVDADAVVVNHQLTVTQALGGAVGHESEFFISQDKHGPCCGIFGFRRRSSWASQMLDTMHFLGDVDKPLWSSVGSNPEFPKWEQTTFKVLQKYFPSTRRLVMVPESTIQNPLSDFDPQAWMMHYWLGCQGYNYGKVADLVQRASDGPWVDTLMARIE